MKKIWMICLLLMCTSGLFAQKGFSALTYSMSLPVGDTYDYISKYSWRGISFDYRALPMDRLLVGFSTGWNVFYEEIQKDTYVDELVTYTGKQFRYDNAIPMFAAADYLFGDPSFPVTGYAGLGLGTTYQERATNIGIYQIYTDAWHFSLHPEVAVMYQFQPATSLKAQVRYNYMFETNDIGASSYIQYNVGFGWWF